MSEETKIENNKTFGDVVRAVFPDASDDEVEILLWEHTPFPMAGEPFVTEQLKVLKATYDAGEKPCSMCNKPRLENKHMCADCESAFEQARG